MRVPLPRLALAAGLIAVLTGSAGAGDGGQGFPTNLSVLDRLADEAVSAVLDSLAFQRGDTVTVMTEGGNEGDGFVAGAFARELTRRGIAVHLTVEVQPTAAAAQEQPPARAQVPPTRDLMPPGFLNGQRDSTAAGYDSLGGAPPDSSATGGGAPTGTSNEPTTRPEAGQQQEGQPETQPETPRTPAHELPTPGSNVVRRKYPTGKILEYKLLEFGINYPSVKRRYKLFGSASVIRLGGVYVQANRILGPDGTVVAVAVGQGHSLDRLSAKERRYAEGANYPFTKPAVPPSNVGRLVEPIAVLGIVASLVYLFYQNQN